MDALAKVDGRAAGLRVRRPSLRIRPAPDAYEPWQVARPKLRRAPINVREERGIPSQTLEAGKDAGSHNSRRSFSHGILFSRHQHLGGQRAGQPDQHQPGPADGVDTPVQRPAHQQLRRRRGGPGGREHLPVDVAVLNQGIRNANDGLSTLQIKDGALNNISNLLDRLSTLATQSASASNTVDRTALNNEFADVRTEIDREAAVAGVSTAAAGFSVFVSNDGTNGKVGGTIAAADVTTLGINASTVDTAANALTAVAAIAAAVTKLGTAQSSVGTLENRLTFAISLANSQVVNNKAADSRIRDANIAEEAANLTRFQILTQSGIAALAQANNQSRRRS